MLNTFTKFQVPIAIIVGFILIGGIYLYSEQKEREFRAKESLTQFQKAKELEEFKLQSAKEVEDRKKEEELILKNKKKMEAHTCYLDKIESAEISSKLTNLSENFLPFCLKMQGYEECSKKQKEALNDIENYMTKMKELCGVVD